MTYRMKLSVALIVTIGALAGCNSDVPVATPTTQAPFDFGVSQSPSVFWPEGEPIDDVASADQAWVALVREWDMLMNVALVTHDYSDKRLQDLNYENLQDPLDRARWNSWDQAADGVTTRLYPAGPTPMLAKSVQHEDDRVTVTMCRASGGWRTLTPPTDDDETWRSRGIVSTFIFDSSESTVLETSGSAEECSLDGARAGYFDPAPAYGEPIPFDQVINLNGEPVDLDEWLRYYGG